jgi:GH35 family endo-1,4-beta-xylanase
VGRDGAVPRRVHCAFKTGYISTRLLINRLQYSGGDVIANLAKKNGQLLRAHALLWHNQLPNWVVNGGFNKATLQSVIETHIANVAGHYKGVPYAWDVVNGVLRKIFAIQTALTLGYRAH